MLGMLPRKSCSSIIHVASALYHDMHIKHMYGHVKHMYGQICTGTWPRTPPSSGKSCPGFRVRVCEAGPRARPVHLIITMIKWIRTSRLSIKNELGLERLHRQEEPVQVFVLGFGVEDLRFGV